MSRHPHPRSLHHRAVPAMLVGALLAAGCQSLPGPGPGPAVVDLDRAMPGDLARARHAHVIAALDALRPALSATTVRLAGIPLDGGLGDALAPIARTEGEAPIDTVRRLAENELIDAGPYRLVEADTATGRLEYRSTATHRHLSITVRPPSAGEIAAGDAFVVTDMVGQASLASLAGRGARDGIDRYPSALSSAGASGPMLAARRAPRDDAAALARLDALPEVERDREDLLGARALLAMRLGEDAKARPLVERGIVRHSGSPLHFTLAGLLFERAGEAQAPASLTMIMEHRFDDAEIRASRARVDRFMRGDAEP